MGDHDDQLRRQLDAWRKDLINLTRANRLLYLKFGSVLEVAEPGISDVYGSLDAGLEVVRADAGDLFADKPGKALRPGQVRFGSLAKSTIEAKLKSLDRTATQTFMDRGLWTLYLAFGVLQWEEAPSGSGPVEKVHSPLLLVPVSAKRNSLREPFRIRLADEEQRFNPALKAKLQQDFGLDLRLPEDEEDLEPNALLDRIGKQVAKRGWTVQPRIMLSTFTFHKEPILHDLVANEQLVMASEAVRGLAIGAEAGVSFEFEPIDEADVDVTAPPEQAVTILDADSSQRRAIAAASAGKSFVMDGPPGTGKSQTIANMIADLMSRRKTVLFVSDKAAALDVVHDRLKAAGLTEFVLELHSHKATRKEVAKELGRSLQTRVKVDPGMSDTDRERLKRKREQLNNYVIAMNEARMPLGQSLHQVLGRITQLQSLPQAPPPPLQAAYIDHARWARTLDVADALARAWGPVTRGESFHWRDIAIDEWDAASRVRVLALLEAATEHIQGLERVAQQVADLLCLPPPSTTSDAERYHVVENLLKERRYVYAPWLSSSRDKTLAERLNSRKDMAMALDAAEASLAAEVGPAWRQLPTHGSEEHSSEVAAVRASAARPSVDAASTSITLESLRQQLLPASGVLSECGSSAEYLASAFGIASTTISIKRAGELAHLAQLADSEDRPEGEWFTPSGLKKAQDAIQRLKPLLKNVKDRDASLRAVFKREVLELDLETLCVRFGSTYRGLFRWFNADYRRDRRALRSLTRSGALRREEVQRLPEALEWQLAVKSFESASAEVSGVMGHFLRGEESDLDAAERAASAVDTASDLAGTSVTPEALALRLGWGADVAPNFLKASASIIALEARWIGFGGVVARLSERPIPEALAGLVQADKALLQLIGSLRRVDEIAGRPARLDDAERWLQLMHAVDGAEQTFSERMAEDAEELGPEWRGRETDWARMSAGLTWAKAVKAALLEPASAECAQRLATIEVEPPRLGRPLGGWAESTGEIALLFSEQRAAQIRLTLRGSFNEAMETVAALTETVDDIGEWHAHVRALAGLAELGLGGATAFCLKKEVGAVEVRGILERAIAEAWADDVLKRDSRLASIRAEDRDALASDFRKLDRQLIRLAARDAISACSQMRPANFQGAAGIILTEAEKQKRHMPVRTLIEKSREVVQAIKPCFMMSPLSVSQFLPPDCSFDVVIFDEASQVKPADAISSIYRGRQLVVAGDQKQLPPTAFFERMDDGGGDEYDEDDPDQFESVLDKCKGTGVFTSLPLRWHYRSQHEHLIAYSNYGFYDGKLVTFPGAVSEAPDLGVEVFHCDGGIYRRGGARDNPKEAELVAERVLFHAQTHPTLSIGVVAFSEAQASTIDAEIERKAGDHPELVALRAEDRLNGLFVKNLEAVQGDERDVIIFSMGFGRDEAGKFTMNFGPLTKKGGERRLNVAITRARRKIEFVTSVRAGEFAAELPSEGARHLRRYLEYAERRDDRMAVLAVPVEESLGDFESPFEVEVARAIRGWGYTVVPQVGCSGYRIDLGVRGGSSQSRFVLGVECDGAMYHSSRAARDRDRLREEVLRRLGWQLHRIWGPSWYRNRTEQERRLRDAIETASAPGAKHPAVPKPATSNEAPRTTTVRWDPEATPSWARPYRVVAPSGHASGYEITDPRSFGAIKRAITLVIEGEGPIQRDRLMRQVVRAFGVERAGNRIQEIFGRALVETKAGDKRIRERNGFLWIEASTLKVRTPVDGEAESRRPVTEVAPQEIERAIANTVRDALRIDRQAVMTYVARLFGWDRNGALIVGAVRDAIKALLKRREISADGDDLLPVLPAE